MCVAALIASCSRAYLRGGTFEPARAAPPLELTDQRGARFNLAEQQGNVVLMFFGYTSCPDVCPTTLAEVATVKRQLSATEQRDLRVVFVTVDPARDTPQTLGNYIAHFDVSFLGLSGNQLEIKRALDAYQVKAVRRDYGDNGGYSMDHSSFIYMIDRRGLLREVIPFGAPSSDVLNDVRVLLRES